MTQFGVPPAPALASPARAAEAIEVYWQALLRDAPLSAFRDGTDDRDVLAAAEELGRLPEFRGPRADGRVTPGTLFRGNALYPDPWTQRARVATSRRRACWTARSSRCCPLLSPQSVRAGLDTTEAWAVKLGGR